MVPTTDHGPSTLPDGETVHDVIKVDASARTARRYFVDGYERVSWRVSVEGSYTIDLSVKVACAPLRSEVRCQGAKVGLIGVHRSRVVFERERGVDFNGFLDLGGEHIGCLGDLGAAFSGGAASPSSIRCSDAAVSQPVLTIEFDNFFSYFRDKTIHLELFKVAGAAPHSSSFNSEIAACAPDRQWERSLRLMVRMRDVGVAQTVGTFNSALGVCKAARQWELALRLLEEMRSDTLIPDSQSYALAIDTCENEGQAEFSLQLMNEMSDVRDDVEEMPCGKSGDLEWLNWALGEALVRCPAAANDLHEHLVASQRSLASFVAEIDAPDSGDGPASDNRLAT